MAMLPTGVSVVTAMAGAQPAGATAGAVSSLSLDPPMMLACLDRGSRTLAAVSESGRFGVNVLRAEDAELAHRFSTKEHHRVKWDGVGWGERAGVPWLDAAVLAVACRVRDLHEGGDHVIATGEVLEAQPTDGEPLVFWAGSYRGLGAD